LTFLLCKTCINNLFVFLITINYIFINLFFNISGYLVLEQVLIAACDCNRIDVAKACLQMLLNKFPDSLRVRRLAITILEAEEK